MNIVIQNGRVVDPVRKLDDRMEILVEDGVISRVASKVKAPEGVRRIDASGMVVAPGFIDLHSHLREPGQEHKETIRTGTLAAVAGGYTAICAMANTVPPNDERAVTEMIIAESKRNGACRVYPIGAVSRGLKGEALAEFGDLRLAGCVGMSDDGMPVYNALLMRSALEYAAMLGVPVIAHEEDRDLSGSGVMHEGFVSTVLGLDAIPAAAEEAMTLRDIVLAELTGGHLHVAHISTRGAIDAVRRAKERGLRVTCEVAPHHFALLDEDVRSFSTNLKMKPPLRSQDHVDAIFDAIADGTVDAIATDHAPHHHDEKNVEFDLAPFGIIGLETAFALGCEHLMHRRKVADLARLVELFSSGPARIFNLPGGSLEEGAPADITLFDPDMEWTVEGFRSKASNSPFRGQTLRGKVLATIVGGEVRYETPQVVAAGEGREKAGARRKK